MARFLKLTNALNGGLTLVNMDHVTFIHAEEPGSRLTFAGDETTFKAQETPEAILKLLGEVRA